MKYPTLMWRLRSGCRVEVEIPYIDEVIVEALGHKEVVNRDTLMALNIPPALPNADFEMTTAPNVSADDEAGKQRCLTAQKLYRLFCAELYGCITTKAAMKQLANEIQEDYGIRRNCKLSGFCGGDPLFMIRLNR